MSNTELRMRVKFNGNSFYPCFGEGSLYCTMEHIDEIVYGYNERHLAKINLSHLLEEQWSMHNGDCYYRYGIKGYSITTYNSDPKYYAVDSYGDIIYFSKNWREEERYMGRSRVTAVPKGKTINTEGVSEIGGFRLSNEIGLSQIKFI